MGECSRSVPIVKTKPIILNDMRDMDYLVVTGGTGEAWWYMIKEEFKGLKSLTVLSGNENSDLPFTFSNVRGYYFYLYRSLKNKRKK